MFTKSKWMGMVLGAVLAAGQVVPAMGQIQMEKLTRGVVAVNQGEGNVFVSWRSFGTDLDGLAFNLYRKTGSGQPVKLNTAPLTAATCYEDHGVNLGTANEWFVRAIVSGAEQAPSKAAVLAADAPVRQYISIPLTPPDGGTTPDGREYRYSANDCSAGDADGDGDYEIFVKWDPSNSHDNSQTGYTGDVFIDAYKMDGTRLWRIDLGKNIRAGAHYTQFMVYDFDGDGKAEMACKTADGTTDSAGTVIGDASKDYRNRNGMILDGPEFLTVFNGLTGKAMATAPFEPSRGDATTWGDNTGNRVDRFNAAVAYLDGQRPSIIMSRGYYTGRGGIGRSEVAAFNFRDGKITPVWHFKASRGPEGEVNPTYLGQGNHGICVADVDGDGKQEIIYGAYVLDDDGKGLYTTGLGHGDAQHTSDLDPTRPGLETFSIHENARHKYGVEVRDSKTGEILNGRPGDENIPTPDIGRGVAFDIDPRYPGAETWSSGGGPMAGLWSIKGEKIAPVSPREVNFCIWWDGDLLREILDKNYIAKWNWETNQTQTLFTAEGCTSNNGTKATPALSADLFGDWREELVLRTNDNSELRIYTTTIPTEHRIYTLMHDPQYRVAIAWQNSAYNQPPHPGFFLGDGMKPAPKPNIRLIP